MDIARTGVILNVEKFDKCVTFYKSLFGLKILFEEQYGDFRLTCFEFDGSYLMIESDGFAKLKDNRSHSSGILLNCAPAPI
jgi:lactoylglutathione lyase